MIKIDFAAELQKLLCEEEPTPTCPLTELARAQVGFLDNIDKNGAGLSLQVEEIYDIIKETDDNAKEVKAAAKRESMLLSGLVAMSDLLDGLLPYLQEHGQTIAAKKEDIMNICGLEQLGFKGERLDFGLHTVAAAENSAAPSESVIHILEKGYAYRGKVIKKATVILSKGE